MWARTNCLLLLANAGLLLGPTHQQCGGVLFPSTIHGTLQYLLPLPDSVSGARCSWILSDNEEAIQLEFVSQQTTSRAEVGCNSAYLEIKLEATENEREFCGLLWSIPEAGRKLVIRGQGPGAIVLETSASGSQHGLVLHYLGELGKEIDSNAAETLTAIPVLSSAQRKEGASQYEGLPVNSTSTGQVQRVAPGNSASEQTSRRQHPSRISEGPNLLQHPLLGNQSHPDSGSSPTVRDTQAEPSPKSTEGLNSSGESTASVNSISTLDATFNPTAMHGSSAALHPTSSDQHKSASISRSGSVSRHQPSPDSLPEPVTSSIPVTILSSEYVSSSGARSWPSARSSSMSSLLLRRSIRSFIISPKVDAGQSLALSLAPPADPRVGNLDGVMIQSTDRVGRPSAPDSESGREPRLPYGWMAGRSRLTTAQSDAGSRSDAKERPGRTPSDRPKLWPTTSRPPTASLSREIDLAPSSQSVQQISLATSSDLRISQWGGGQRRSSQWTPSPLLEDGFWKGGEGRLLPGSQAPRLLVTWPTPIRDPSLHTSSLSSEGEATVSLDFDYVSGIERTGDPEPIRRQEFPATSSQPITPSEQRGGQGTTSLSPTSRTAALSSQDQYLNNYPPQTSATVTHFEGLQRKFHHKDISSTAPHTVTKAGPWNVFDVRRLMSHSSKLRLQGVSNGDKTDAEGLSRASSPSPQPAAAPALSSGETTRTAPSHSAAPSTSSPSLDLVQLANAEGSGHVDSGEWAKTGDGGLTDGGTTVEVNGNTHTPDKRLAVTPSVKPNFGFLVTSTLSGRKDRIRSETTGGSSTGSALRAELLGEALRLEGGSSSPSNSDQENSAESPPMVNVVPGARVLATFSPERSLSNANLQPNEVDLSEIPASKLDHHRKERLSITPTTTWFPWRSSELPNSRPPAQIALSRAWTSGGKMISPAETSVSAKRQEMTEGGQSEFAPKAREFSEQVQPGTESQPTVTNWAQSQPGLQTTSQPAVEQRGAVSWQTAGSSFPVWSEEPTPPSTISFKVNHLKPSSEQGPMTSEEPDISWTGQLRPVTKDLSSKPHVISTEDLDALTTWPAGPWLSEQRFRNILTIGTNPTTSVTEIDLVTGPSCHAPTSGPESVTSHSSAIVMAEFVTTHHTPSTSALSNDISGAWNTDISQTQSTDDSQTQSTVVSQTQSTGISQTQNPDISQTQSTDVRWIQSTDVIQTQSPDVNQTQSTDDSQTQSTGISQTQSTVVSQTQSTVVSQTQSTDVSQTQSTDVNQTQSTDVNQTQSTDDSQTQSTGISQTQSTDVSQTQSTVVSQTQSTDVSQTQSTDVSQTKGTGVSQTQSTDVSQTQNTDVRWIQNPDVSQTQDLDISQTQSTDVIQTKDTGVSQAQSTDIRQTQSTDISQTQNPDVSQTQSTGVSQTKVTGVSQTQNPDISQTQSTDVSQTHSTDINQTQSADVSQTKVTVVSQTQSTDVNQTQSTDVGLTQSTDINQTQNADVSQTKVTVVSQTQSTDVSQTQSTVVSQSQNPVVSQTQITDVRQTQSTDISQTQSTDVSQAQNPDVSQAQNPDVRQTQSTDISQTQITDVRQTQSTDISQTQSTDVSQAQNPDVSQAQNPDVRQTQSTDISQTQSTGVSQTQSTDISQTQSTDVRWIQSTAISQTQSTDVSQTQSTVVSQSQNPDVSQTQITDVRKTRSTGVGQTQSTDVRWIQITDVIQTQSIDISQTQSPDVNQTQSTDVSQTQSTDINQTQSRDTGWKLSTNVSQILNTDISLALSWTHSPNNSWRGSPDISRTLGPVVSQTQEPDISQTQGPDIRQTQGPGIRQTQGPVLSQTWSPVIRQTWYPDIRQTQEPGIRQTRDPGIRQTRGPDIRQTQGPGSRQTQGPVISQTQEPGIRQTWDPDIRQTWNPDIRQTRGPDIRQTQGPGIRQTQGPVVSQTWSPDIKQTGGPEISQTLGPEVSQTWGQDVSWTHGSDIRQTGDPDIRQTWSAGTTRMLNPFLRGTLGSGPTQSAGVSQSPGPDVSQSLGPDVSQSLGPDVSQSSGPEVSQSLGPDVSQSLGPDVGQSLGPDVSQSPGPEVSQTQGEGISRTLGPDVRWTWDQDVSWTPGPDISQTQREDISQTQGEDISQMWSTDVSQLQNTGIIQTLSLEVSWTQGTDISRTLSPDIRQTRGMNVSQTLGLDVSQTQGMDVSQTGGLEENHTWSRFGTAVSLPTASTGSVAFPFPTSRPSTDSPVRLTAKAASRETGRTVQSTSQQLPPGRRRALGNTVSPPTPPVGRKQIFIVEDQQPLVREGVTVKIPTKLILDMTFNLHLKDSKSDEYQKLAKDFALKISPFYDKIPGFQQLQIKRFSAGSVKIEFDAIFRLTKVESFLLEPDLIFNVSGLWLVVSRGFEIGGARVVTVYVTEKVIALCGEVLFCQKGFQCVHSKSGNVSCTSLCHTAYCKNSGICTHNPGQAPMCQCPVGSDYWFMGPRCDHRMTNQILVAIVFGVVLALLVVLAAVAFVVLRRFKVVLTEAKIDQTRSSYKRFSRFDDFSNQHQSQSWLSFSVNSLDNPGFSNSDELIHLQILDTSFYSCYEESVTGTYSSQRTGPRGQPAFRHSLQNLDASVNSINEYMGDSGKASDMSVCSWPGEPFRWSPFPILYQLGRERPFKARRPHSYYEGMELVSMERNWTA